MVDDFGKIRTELQAMPVPEPRAGFVDRVLSVASAQRVPHQPTRARRTLARPLTWVAAAAGALAASLVWFVIVSARPDASLQPNLQLALHESREVSLVIDSERPLEGATIRLYVSGGVALAGYEHQAKIQWLTSLNQGANLISLPVIAIEPGSGTIVAEIEHEGKTRRVNLLMQVRG